MNYYFHFISELPPKKAQKLSHELGQGITPDTEFPGFHLLKNPIHQIPFHHRVNEKIRRLQQIYRDKEDEDIPKDLRSFPIVPRKTYNRQFIQYDTSALVELRNWWVDKENKKIIKKNMKNKKQAKKINKKNAKEAKKDAVENNEPIKKFKEK